MSKKSILSLILLVLIAFAIPIEHKYDKLFRFYSLTLIPEGLFISQDYEKKLYFYPSDLLCLALFLIALCWYRIPLRTFFANPLWILFLFAFLSIALSPFSHYPIAYSRLLQLFTPFVLFSFLSSAFEKKEGKAIIRIILITLVTAALFQTAVGTAQYFRQKPLGLRLLGESNQPAVIKTEGGTRWIFDSLLQHESKTEILKRASGTLPHPNIFGGFLFISILATYALSMKQKRPFLLLTLPFQIFALAISYSRSALFALLLASALWFSLMFYRYKKDFRLYKIALCTLCSFLITAALLGNQYRQRGGIMNSTTLTKKSDSTRKFHQQMAWNIIQDSPYFGLGYSQFSQRAASFFPENIDRYTRSTAPHNIFLFLACETGLISLGALMFTLFSLFFSLFKHPLEPEGAALGAMMMGFAFIGCCDFYPILFHQGKMMFFLTLGLMKVIYKREKTFLNTNLSNPMFQ